MDVTCRMTSEVDFLDDLSRYEVSYHVVANERHDGIRPSPDQASETLLV